MPKIYQYLAYIFYFYSNEHLPIHVHVAKDGREGKCEIEYQDEKLKLTWRKVKGTYLTEKETGEAEAFIRRFHLQIVQKWNQVFIFGKTVKCEKITKRL